MNVLYVIPNLKKVSGGPLTRISMFKKEFKKDNGSIIEGRYKLFQSVKHKKLELVYVESATNRISISDFLALIWLRIHSKRVIVFIRDIYIELFPENYKTPRNKVTLYLNKVSNFFLAFISTQMAFPTKSMGDIFFEKNTSFPKRNHFTLPPGCISISENAQLPDFTKKIGILYLGSVSYANSGFENYLNFAEYKKDKYHFFVLSGDKNAKNRIGEREYVQLATVAHSNIPTFIKKNNIAIALHTRPINEYDQITFPIKILDFLSFQLPFLSERHRPLKELLGDEHYLFVDILNHDMVHAQIQKLIDKKRYTKTVHFLKELAIMNAYGQRYKKLFECK